MYNPISSGPDISLTISDDDSNTSTEDDDVKNGQDSPISYRSNISGFLRTENSNPNKNKTCITTAKTTTKMALTREGRKRQRLNARLLEAIEHGNMNSFLGFLDQGAKLDAVCRKTGLTGCHIAAFFGRSEMLSTLLSKGADPLQKSWYDGCLPIHLAVWSGHVSCLKILHHYNPDSVGKKVIKPTNEINFQIENLDSWIHNHENITGKIPVLVAGSTALHIACRRIKVDCVLFLLENGADVHITDNRGLTAISVINEDMTFELEDVIAETSTVNENLTQDSTQLDEIDTNSNSNAAESNVSGGTDDFVVLHKTGKSKKILKETLRQAQEQRDKIVKVTHKPRGDSIGIILNSLIEYGATFEIPEKDGQDVEDSLNQKGQSTTLLHTAVLSQDSKLIEQLIDKGANMFSRNSVGDTPIDLAIKRRLPLSLETLLRHLRKSENHLDIKDSSNRTPLQVAICESWIFGVSVLLEAGASVVAKGESDNSVLHYAARTGNMLILEELLTLQEITQVINWKNDFGQTALIIAVQHGNVECVRLLLDFGASTRITISNNLTVVHISADKGFLEILEMILDSDPDLIDAKTNDGLTALHIASTKGHLHCVKYLLSKNSDEFAKSATSYFGGTALHFAARNGHLPIVECLIQHNKEIVNVVNADNWYPLHVSATFGHKDCVECIVKFSGNLSHLVSDSEGNKKSAVDIISYTIPEPIPFLEQLLDSYIHVNDMPLNHPKCVVTFNYDILMPSGEYKKQMKVLNALLNNESVPLQQKLLLHPLIETFLYFKWRKLRIFFMAIVILYILFTISLTVFALAVHIWKLQTVKLISGIIMLSTLLILSFQEIMHASKLQRYYVTDIESLLKWSTFITALIIGVGGFSVPFCQQNLENKITSSDTYWQDAAAVSVLLSWIELLFLLSRFPGWGFYVLMFFKVASNVMKVFSTFACLILGFIFSFHILFRGMPPFTNLWESLIKIIIMTSELEYTQLFESVEKDSSTYYIGRLIFLLYVMLVGIVLMNLMIGLAVNDISLLEAEGKSRTLAKQIDFLNLLEMYVYNKKLISHLPERICRRIQTSRAVPRELKIYPGRPLCPVTKKLPSKLKESITEKVLSMQNLRRAEKYSKRRLSNSSSGAQSSLLEEPKLEVLEKLKNIANELDGIKYRLSYMKNY